MIRALAVAMFALSLAAQDAVSVALLVREPTLDAARLDAHLAATDVLTRATAARVAAVRGVTAALPRVREVLAKEANAEVAREQIRALVINGSEDDVAATDLYLKYRPQLRNASSFLVQSLMGRPSEIHAAAMWELAQRGGEIPAVDAHEGASAEEAFAAEVLRRMRGNAPVERAEWMAWLSDTGRSRVPTAGSVREHLTAKERSALVDKRLAGLPHGPSLESSRTVAAAPFRVSLELPAGLAATLLRKSRCNAAWIGTAVVKVDPAGRVQAADASITETKCGDEAETLLLLSFAEPLALTSELASEHVLLVKPDGGGCFDEYPAGATRSELQRTGGNVTAPKVLERVEPHYPLSAREAGITGVVLAEAIITRAGCVRDVRLIRQTQSPSLNASALLALSKWKFRPGMLDGQPVDVIFHLTLKFSLR